MPEPNVEDLAARLAEVEAKLASLTAPLAKKIGAPSRRTPEIAARIVEALKIGETYAGACAYAGISQSMFYEWKATDPEFLERVENALAELRMVHLARIEAAAQGDPAEPAVGSKPAKPAKKGDWRASAWMLEHRFRPEFGPRSDGDRPADPGAAPVIVNASIEDTADRLELSGHLAEVIRANPTDFERFHARLAIRGGGKVAALPAQAGQGGTGEGSGSVGTDARGSDGREDVAGGPPRDHDAEAPETVAPG